MKKTALTFSLLAALSAVCLTSCDYKKLKTDKGQALFTIDEVSYAADDLLGIGESSYNILSTDDGAEHLFESVYGALAKSKYETVGSQIEGDVDDLMEEFDEEVESYASENSVTVNSAQKTKLEELGYDDLDDLRSHYTTEALIEQLEDDYESDNYEIKLDEDYTSSMLYRYVANTHPMIVRHILSKVSDSCTIYEGGEITSDEVSKLTTIFQRLCLKDDSLNTFKNIAIDESEDSTNTKGGSLGIVDTYTSFVQPFKLGLYYSEIEQATTEDEKNSLASAYGISESKLTELETVNGTIDTIDMAVIGSVLAGLKDDKSVELQKANKFTSEADYDASLYVRNYVYNKYLNNQKVHYIGVNINGTDKLDTEITKILHEIFNDATVEETKLETIQNSAFYKAVKDTTVEAVKENDKKIVLAKSEYGFHFMTIDWSAVKQEDTKTAYQYFMYKTSDALTGSDKSYVTLSDTTGYSTSSIAQSTRKNEIHDRVFNYIKGGFESISTNESLYSYEIYKTYISDDFVTEAVRSVVNELVDDAIESKSSEIAEAKENEWKEYTNTIKAYNSIYAWLYA